MVVSEESLLSANGLKYTKEDFMKFGSFVEQDDALFQGSTPRELLMFAAALRTELSAEKVESTVDALISLLGLYEC
jgi:ABC-type multidrug transport system ATPase subunit